MKKKSENYEDKQYAHLHAMAKTPVKFQNDWPKTVGGVALTSQLLTNGRMDERTGHGTPISITITLPKKFGSMGFITVVKIIKI